MAEGDWKEMFQAAVDGDLELVRYHLSNGCDPNYQHPEILSTPLVATILNEHLEVAKLLIESGAKKDLKSYFDDMTPLQAAKKKNKKEFLDLLS